MAAILRIMTVLSAWVCFCDCFLICGLRQRKRLELAGRFRVAGIFGELGAFADAIVASVSLFSSKLAYLRTAFPLCDFPKDRVVYYKICK